MKKIEITRDHHLDLSKEKIDESVKKPKLIGTK